MSNIVSGVVKCSRGRVMSEAVGDVYTDGGPTNVGAFLKGSNKYLTTNDLHITTIATVRMDEVVKLRLRLQPPAREDGEDWKKGGTSSST